MDLEYLSKFIDQGEIDKAEDIVKDIGSKRYVEAIPILVKYLKITENVGLRNTIALALSDIGQESTIEALIDIINDPKTSGARGTLIYALQGFQYDKYFEYLIELLKDDGYEARIMALMLLKDINQNIPSQLIHQAISNIEKEKLKIKEKYKVLVESLNILKDMEN